MSIRIITDSTSDIPLDKQKELGIDIVSLSVIFGDKKYTDGVDLQKEEFYDMLSKSTVLPSTSQVNPDGFIDLFKNYTDAGDDVIVITISSILSGTYQSAVIAKDMVGSEKIYLVDSSNATFGLALLVYEAIKLREGGKSAADIHSHLLEIKDKIKFYAVVNTLKYLKMGGRLSSSAAMIGEVLSIKPIVSIINGKVESIAKARGQKAAYAWILEKIKEAEPSNQYPLVLGHSNAPNLMDDFIKYISSAVDTTDGIVCEIGCVIGTHAGPGCLGLAYIAE